MRLLKRISLIIIVLLGGFILNLLISTGFFRTVENHFEGEILKKVPLPGAEDIMVSSIDSFALISSTARKIYPPKEEEVGGLYYMDLKTGNYTPVHLTSSFKKPFAPHGISMFKKDSTYKIMAVNHTLQGHSLEVFTLHGTALTHEKTITDTSLISPNDVVMIDENRFYFTNDHGYTKGVGRFMEGYIGLSVAAVIYFDGEKFSEVADGISYANGINYDQKRNLLYVASPRDFLIKVYSRNTDGTLTFVEDIPCDTGVDNIEIDQEGNLWSGAHPNLLRFTAYAKGKKETSPSEIIKIKYTAKGNYQVEKIFADDGSTMSASSVAVPFGDIILTGNVKDKKFLILRPEKH